MNRIVEHFLERLKPRLVPFGDLTAWVLLIVAAIPLLMIDRPMFVTLIQWTLYALALGGIAVVLSRVLLPHVRLSELLEEARKGNGAAGAVAAAVILFLGILMLSMVLWARA